MFKRPSEEEIDKLHRGNKLEYEILKNAYQRLSDTEQHQSRFEPDETIRRQKVKILAESDPWALDKWPLHILRSINGELSEALTNWTANNSKKIKKAERHYLRSGEKISGFQDYKKIKKHFSDLPIFEKCCSRYMNSLDFKLKVDAEFSLKSFTSFSGDCGEPVLALSARYVLRLGQTNVGRYVGGLSAETYEDEVLFPAGTKFLVESHESITWQSMKKHNLSSDKVLIAIREI